MKKGLSVLLIAAALFGFYGGAINLNDVLACKEYWEIKGEESTADMNKLEDGLNQLKENEQAYLDGVDALADGEQALADGEVALAKGQKTLAKGEADYAAAPGKLKKGKKDLSDITRLINGLVKANKSFNDYSVGDNGKKGPSWKQGFEAKAKKSDFSDAGLEQARKVITATLNTEDNKKSVALIEQLSGKKDLIKGVSGNITYAKYDSGIKELITAFDAAAKALTELKNMAEQYAADTKQTQALKAGLRTETEVEVAKGVKKKISELTLAQTEAVLAGAKKSVSDAESARNDLEAKKANLEKIPEAARSTYVVDENGTTAEQALAQINSGISQYNAGIEAGKAKVNSLSDLVNGRKQAVGLISGVRAKAGDKLSMAGALDSRLTSLVDAINALADVDMPNGTFADTYEKLQGGLKVLAQVLDTKIKEIESNKNTFKAWDAGYQQLKDGQDQLADMDEGIPYAFQKMRSNATLRKALKSKVPGTYAKLAKYTGSRLARDDMDAFDKDMKEVSSMINKALPVLRKVKADGQKTYNQGLKDYKAAPAKLAAGRAQLAEGLQTLMDGRQQLADGKEKLAEYEDGEQQVRDGLATLMGTKPDGGLASILERRNGDDDFDNGDKHLDLDEGLDAVDVGRGYQSDSGELITKELTNRAVGAGLGLGAGALALLAGLLSFIKKNKAAGISAILSAIAGASAIGVGLNAGMEFSNIAGSHAGSMAHVAAGILIAVAAVHAIVHFTAKKEAQKDADA